MHRVNLYVESHSIPSIFQ